MILESIIAPILAGGTISALINIGMEIHRHKKEIEKDKAMKGFNNKLDTYHKVVDLFSDFLHEINILIIDGKISDAVNVENEIAKFNKLRMRTYGYLCIYADQKTIDAHENLVEYIYDYLEGKIDADWETVRKKVMKLLNCFREDYDPKLTKANYNGNR